MYSWRAAPHRPFRFRSVPLRYRAPGFAGSFPRARVTRDSAASASPRPIRQSARPRTARAFSGSESTTVWNRKAASFSFPSIRSCSPFRRISGALDGSRRRASRRQSIASASRPSPNRRFAFSYHAWRFPRFRSRTRV